MAFAPWETLLELRSELRSDALSVTTIEFTGIQIHYPLFANLQSNHELSHGSPLINVPAIN